MPTDINSGGSIAIGASTTEATNSIGIGSSTLVYTDHGHISISDGTTVELISGGGLITPSYPLAYTLNLPTALLVEAPMILHSPLHCGNITITRQGSIETNGHELVIFGSIKIEEGSKGIIYSSNKEEEVILKPRQKTRLELIDEE